MGFKKALTKMGLVEEDAQVTPKAKVTTSVATPVPAQTFSQLSYSGGSAGTYQAPAQIDPAISEMLNKSLQSSKLSGFDYMKFIASVEKSKSSGVSEDARFKMVYSTAQELGISKEGLVESGKHYLGVLTEDENDFNADCATFEKDEVTARETKLSQIETSMTDLSKKLAQLQQDHQTLQQEVAEQKAQLESRKSSFQATLQTFRATIEQNIQKINQYLQ